jgi:hypothetical protein
MGEIQDSLFPLEFNKSVQVWQEKCTSLTIDPGAVLLREIGERLGLWRLLEQALVDGRNPALITHPYIELLRTVVLLAAQGWSSQQEVDLLRHDPAFRLAVSERKGQRALQARRAAREPDGLASQPTVSRLMSSLSSPWNLDGLTLALCSWAAQRNALSGARPRAEVTIDLDSLPADVHGQQPGSAYNAHYGCRCFHPLLVSWEFGDFLGARLRPGNVHTADDAHDFVLPFLGWAATLAQQVWLRMDAGFPSEPFLNGLERRSYRYVARLKSNARLERLAAPYLDRILQRPWRKEQLHIVELDYRAASWSRDRRVVLVFDERPFELVPNYFFLVSNAPAAEVSGLALLKRYRQRGSTEKDYGDWLNALDLTLSSTNRPKSCYRGEVPLERSYPIDSFAVNEATLLLSLLTANLLHAARLLIAGLEGRCQSRETFRRLVLKAGARFTRSGRYVKLRIQQAQAEYWREIGKALRKLHPTRGSPTLLPLPTPA